MVRSLCGTCRYGRTILCRRGLSSDYDNSDVSISWKEKENDREGFEPEALLKGCIRRLVSQLIRNFSHRASDRHADNTA